jgi:glycoside hydrolase-like protein
VKRFIEAALTAGLLALSPSFTSDNSRSGAHVAYLGFDRNDYPGDGSLKLLRGKFSFAGFWLNNPPGASSNSWTGKRRVVQEHGFGFLVVFNGRTSAQIRAAADATKLGASDGAMAVSSARREGFPAKTIIFLDQEEGGRLLPEQRAYLHAWADAVQSAGFRAGVYCSGIAFKEGSGATVITAEDIRQNAGGRQLAYWVTNDSCPPSPGCVLRSKPPNPATSGVFFADVWQFAQSPRRADFASGCTANYSNDGNCYPPGGEAERLHVDLDVGISTDPSHGRTR